MKKFFLFALVLAFSLHEASAETPEEKGLAIAVEGDRRDTGWKDMTNTMQMILQDKSGNESTRIMRSSNLEVEGDGDKSLIIFDNPLDITGTAFLSFTHPTQPDEQWLYLPALRRVKRITSNNKSGPFVGSVFAYEDISSQEVEKYTYKWLRDEAIEGQDTFVLERYPAYEFSGYTRQLAWIDKAMYQPLKIEFYDRKNALLKTVTFHDYKQFGQYWRPAWAQMDNHQTGKGTKLSWQNYAFNNGLSDRDFDRNTLKRIR